MIAVKICLSGDLHKKGFRYYAQEKGISLGITGEISHNDGSTNIIIHAEGEEESINTFSEWCTKGTPYCKVTQAVVEPAEIVGYKYFDVLQDSSDSKNKADINSRKGFVENLKLLKSKLSGLFTPAK